MMPDRPPDESPDAGGGAPPENAPTAGGCEGLPEAGPADAHETAAAGEPDGRPKKAGPSNRRKILDWIGVLLIAAAVALGARTFVVQAYYIPSESMIDTLEINDRVIVSKLNYRFVDIDRGDVIVFDCPDDVISCPVDDFIKRVVALPGETIRFHAGAVYIDDALLQEPYVDGLHTWSAGMATTMAGCVEAIVIDSCTVRDGWVYVLGDNRPYSRDSRWFGPIPQDSVAGRAAFKVWPITDLGPL